MASSSTYGSSSVDGGRLTSIDGGRRRREVGETMSMAESSGPRGCGEAKEPWTGGLSRCGDDGAGGIGERDASDSESGLGVWRRTASAAARTTGGMTGLEGKSGEGTGVGA